jgi:hypothetical protein
VEAAIHSQQLTSATVARDQIIVVTAPDHQLVKRKPITPTDLMEEDLRRAGRFFGHSADTKSHLAI